MGPAGLVLCVGGGWVGGRARATRRCLVRHPPPTHRAPRQRRLPLQPAPCCTTPAACALLVPTTRRGGAAAPTCVLPRGDGLGPPRPWPLQRPAQSTAPPPPAAGGAAGGASGKQECVSVRKGIGQRPKRVSSQPVARPLLPRAPPTFRTTTPACSTSSGSRHMAQLFCHACGASSAAPPGPPACSRCGSDFVEVVEVSGCEVIGVSPAGPAALPLEAALAPRCSLRSAPHLTPLPHARAAQEGPTAAAPAAAARPAPPLAAGGGSSSSRTFNLPGGLGTVHVWTSSGGGLPHPGASFGGGEGARGQGSGGPSAEVLFVEALLGAVAPDRIPLGPFGPLGGAQDSEHLDRVMTQVRRLTWRGRGGSRACAGPRAGAARSRQARAADTYARS